MSFDPGEGGVPLVGVTTNAGRPADDIVVGGVVLILGCGRGTRIGSSQ